MGLARVEGVGSAGVLDLFLEELFEGLGGQRADLDLAVDVGDGQILPFGGVCELLGRLEVVLWGWLGG